MQRFSVRDWEERAGGQPDRAWDGWAPWEAALGWMDPLGSCPGMDGPPGMEAALTHSQAGSRPAEL